MSPTPFVDTHCHLFNFVDIPVYETLAGKVSMNTTGKLLTALSATGPLMRKILQHKIHDYKEFIQFFERPLEDNLRWLAEDIATGAPHDTDLIIINPLVMDFDCVRQENCKPISIPCSKRTCEMFSSRHRTMSQDPSSRQQLDRLLEAIQVFHTATGSTVHGRTIKVFPFLGFDLRKLAPRNSTAFRDLKALWDSHGLAPADRATDPANIPSGTVLGIKLYPPIGFNPYPRERAARAVYLEFYQWCIRMRIPITVHCQSGSYSADRNQREIDSFAHAANWRRLFADWSAGKLDTTEDIRELRINFAHFGGESGLEDMIDPIRLDGIDENSWTYDIVSLLCDYPHTYSDLSAFDWSSKGDVRNFARTLEYDRMGKLHSGEYRVSEKLLWGSDVPMIFDSGAFREGGKRHGRTGYTNLMDNFRKAVFTANPKHLGNDEKQQIIDNMTIRTPVKFLMG